MIGKFLYVGVGVLVAVGCFSNVGSAQMNEFRIETDILVPSQTKPVQQTLTLFQNGIAYDFSRDEPDQITVVDPERKRIVMIDGQRQIQTHIDLTWLNSYMESARVEAANRPGLAKFLEDSKVIEFDKSTETFTVGSNVLRYAATMQFPSEEAVAIQFARFADASAYLNAWRVNSPPPFARIALNEAVARQGAIPEEITRTTYVTDQERVVDNHVLKCRLHPNWKLSKDDYARIDDIGRMLEKYQTVSNTAFYQKGPTVKSANLSQPELK